MPDQKIHNDPDLGEILIKRSARSTRIGLHVHPDKGIYLSIPKWCTYRAAIAFFDQKKKWAMEAVLKQKEKLRREVEQGRAVIVPEAEMDALVDAMRKRAKAVLPVKLKNLAARYGFTYNKVFIKHNSSNWGSCSALGNINLNINLVRVPEILADYVILHELAHLSHPNHGPRFHSLLETMCADTYRRHLEKMKDSPVQEADAVLFKDIQAYIKKTSSNHPFSRAMELELKKYRLI